MGLLFNDECGWRTQQRQCDELNPRAQEEHTRREEQNKPRPLRSRIFPQWARVLELMQTIEASQRELEELLQYSTTKKLRWPEFLAAGGNSAADLEHWLAGQKIGPAPLRVKKHLRLVASTRGLPRYRPLHPEAA